MTKLTGVKAVLADPKRLAKWRANPGLRKQLPDKYLTPEQRLARRMGQEIFPGAGVTGFEQARQAKSQTDQVYGPQKLALQDQQNVLGAQRQRNAGWWDQYVGQLRAMQAPAANTVASPNQLGQYGAALDAGTVGTQQAAGGYQQALSSLAQGLLANNVAVGGQRKLESLAGLDAQELGVVQKRGALQKEADLFKQDAKDKIKSGARQSMLEDIAYKTKQYAAEQKAALDAQKAGATKRDLEQKRILARQKLALDRQKASETARHNTAQENKKTGKKGKEDKSPFLSTKDQSKFWQKVTQAKALIGTPVKNKDGIETGGNYTPQTLLQAGFTTEQVRIAKSLIANKGGLSSRDQKTLHSVGIQLKGRYKVVKK